MKTTIGILSMLLILTACSGDERVTKDTKFLKAEVALHYFRQGKLLKCYDSKNFNKEPTIVTNNFEVMNLGGILFTQTNFQTGDTQAVNAYSCLLN